MLGVVGGIQVDDLVDDLVVQQSLPLVLWGMPLTGANLTHTGSEHLNHTCRPSDPYQCLSSKKGTQQDILRNGF